MPSFDKDGISTFYSTSPKNRDG